MTNLLISQRIKIDVHDQLMDTLESTYTSYFNSLEINLYPVSNFIRDLDGYLEKIPYSGLILSGGGDVNPEHIIGNNKGQFDYYQQREKIEFKLIKKMIAQKLPILGICKGMQELNCYFGGKLTGNIFKEIKDRSPGKEHLIKITKEIHNLKGKYEVNHYHNQGLKKEQLAESFTVFAVDNKYNIVEGIIHKRLPIMGIQWHPEREGGEVFLNKELIIKFLKSSWERNDKN